MNIYVKFEDIHMIMLCVCQNDNNYLYCILYDIVLNSKQRSIRVYKLLQTGHREEVKLHTYAILKYFVANKVPLQHSFAFSFH